MASLTGSLLSPNEKVTVGIAMTGSLLTPYERLTAGIPDTGAGSLVDGGKAAGVGDVKPGGGSFAPGFNPPDDLD